MYLAYDSVDIEEKGKPVVMMCKKGFERDARSAGAVKNLPGLRVVTSGIPGDVEATNIAAIQEGLTKEVVDNVVAALTSPLTDEEKAPKQEAETPARIIFKGSLEEVNRFYYRRGWTGGLPIMPPTEEAVREMLQGTDLPADHVVAKLPLRDGNATVEKIAVNAVMAGALPTYMPVLIAGVQALAEHVETAHAVTTLMSNAPCWIINGPIHNDININTGRSLFSSGIIANTAIARAMQLIIRNIGGVRPGIEMMNFYGHTGMFTLAFGENEEESPWEPLHVEQGLRKEDSAVSLFFVSGNSMVLSGGSSFDEDKAFVQGMADAVVNNLQGRGMGGANCLFTISSGAANLLAMKGWTKEKVKSYILNEAKKAPRPEWTARFESSWGPPEEQLKIVVAGAVKISNTAYQFSGGFLGWVTKKVELPAKWEELVKKYKSLVPPYAEYLNKEV